MRAYVGVGTNLGDRWRHLAQAARGLRAAPGVALLRASRVYDTEPVGPPGQGRYLNAALEIETRLPPRPLLRLLQRIEEGALRRRALRWGPRSLDLDLLLYAEVLLRTPELTLPHPGLAERRFVLAPLAELCPELVVPGAAVPVAELLRRAPPNELRIAGIFPA